MPRSKIIVGNWKMNKTIAEAEAFAKNVQGIVVKAQAKQMIVGIAPTFLSLGAFKKNEGKLITVAQNVHFADSGAFTGEVSYPMLKELGVKYVLIGHSERRQYFGETNATCNKKLAQAVVHQFTPIFCVGETLTEFESGKTKDVVKTQLVEGLAGISAEAVANFVIAYEPVWSIGTGKNADTTIAENVCSYIRQQIGVLYGPKVADRILIQYGGSVKPENIKDYLKQPNIDGALVGGASLKEDSFTALLTNLL